MEQHGGLKVICHQKAQVVGTYKLCGSSFTVMVLS